MLKKTGAFCICVLILLTVIPAAVFADDAVNEEIVYRESGNVDTYMDEGNTAFVEEDMLTDDNIYTAETTDAAEAMYTAKTTDATEAMYTAETTDAIEVVDAAEIMDTAGEVIADVRPAEDTDELLQKYLDVNLNINDEPAFAAFQKRVALRRLKGVNLTVYNALKTQIEKIASGEKPYTRIELSKADAGIADEFWTAAELGISSITEVVDGKLQISTEAAKAAVNKLGIDFDTIMHVMMVDCPYELYWYDKTEGAVFEGVPVIAKQEVRDGNAQFVLGIGEKSGVTLSFYFPVSADYAKKDSNGNLVVTTAIRDGEEKITGYYTDETVLSSISSTVSNAQKVVNDFAGSSDYGKLVKYKDWIAEEVSYDRYAASANVPYGNPWQLIYVFDGDPDTNVVCEGYAKAFHYLCQLTAFNSDQIESRLVDGQMTGGTGAGKHMWNVVTMDDQKNYLVDITNCDEGTIGAPDKLFLVGMGEGDDAGSVENGYSISIGGKTIKYTYGSDIKNVYSVDDDGALQALSLAEGKYVHTHIPEVIPATSATCTNPGMTEGSRCSDCGTVVVKPEVNTADPAKGHMIETLNACEASCEDAGYTGDQFCTVCNNTVKTGEVIPAKGHTSELKNYSKADCIHAGYTGDKVCKVCKKEIEKGNEIPATGIHTYDTGKDNGDGTITYTCTVCNDTKIESTTSSHDDPASGGSVNDSNTDDKNGSDSKSGESQKDNPISADSVKAAAVDISVMKSAIAASMNRMTLTYTGSKIKPVVMFIYNGRKLVPGSDFTLSYKNNKNVGTAALIVTGKGDFKGSFDVPFVINPKGTSVSKLIAAKKSFSVKWKKQTKQTTGYQIQYSTKKNFKSGNKTVTVKSAKKTSQTIKKLKAKKTYYVRIRTIKKLRGKTYYSKWSAKKKVKTK